MSDAWYAVATLDGTVQAVFGAALEARAREFARGMLATEYVFIARCTTIPRVGEKVPDALKPTNDSDDS